MVAITISKKPPVIFCNEQLNKPLKNVHVITLEHLEDYIKETGANQMSFNQLAD